MIIEETDFKYIMEDNKNKSRYEWILKHPDKIISWLNFHGINLNVTVNGPEGTEIWKFPYNEKLASKIANLYLRYTNRKRVREAMEKEGRSKKEIEKELGDTDPSKPNYFPY